MTFEKLDQHIAAIRAFPELEKYITEKGFLDQDNPNEELDKLFSEMSNHMAELFIDNKGQHNDVYYLAKRSGYRLVVTESDSFGPLAVTYYDAAKGFAVSYG